MTVQWRCIWGQSDIVPSSLGARDCRLSLVSGPPVIISHCPTTARGFAYGSSLGHLRPVIIKPCGRIFEISDANPIQGKCGKCGRALSPQKSKGLRRVHGAKTWKARKMQKMRTLESGKKKAHKHKLFGPVTLGTTPGMSQGQTGFVPGTNRVFLLILRNGSPVCPWDKPSLSLGHSWERRAAEKVYVLKVYVPFSLAREHRKCRKCG